MNYIWDVLLRADTQQIERSKVRFTLAKQYSPYMEISFQDFNTCELDQDQDIEINPYYRFYSIFKDLFHPDFDEREDLRKVLLDIMMHYLAEIDLKQGFSKNEYYMKFISEDILAGVHGQQNTDTFTTLTRAEKHTILSGILQIYTTGVSLLIFKKVIRQIFTQSSVYQNQDAKDELFIYLNERKTEVSTNKLELLCEFFLPIHIRRFIYWEYHFCIMDVAETSTLDKIALY